MTKTEMQPLAYVTLRFAGDDLDPAEISAVLPVKPGRAHRKGETFFAGPRSGYLRGNTGIWFLATDKLLQSSKLADHLQYIENLLGSGGPRAGGDAFRLTRLREILRDCRAEASFSIFWYGSTGVIPQTIPASFARLAGELDASIEVNLDADHALECEAAATR
jgi:hypothetical protein